MAHVPAATDKDEHAKYKENRKKYIEEREKTKTTGEEKAK